jgi:membrane fusion protein, multidrug efflux system
MNIRAWYILPVLSIATLLLFSGCGPGANEFVPPPPPDVTVSRPVKKNVTKWLTDTGTAAAIESVEIRARVQGFLESIHFQPRAKVKKDDLLFVIDPRPFKAKVDQAKAALEGKQAELHLAQVELDKAQYLLDKQAISEMEQIRRTAERDLKKADVQRAKADLEAAVLDLNYTKVKSPIDGVVSRNLVDVGNLVGATEKTLLTTVVNDDRIYAYFNVSELELLPLIRKYSEVKTHIPSEQRLEKEPTPAHMGLADEKGYPLKGRIDFADTTVDTETGTIQVRAVFPNTTGVVFPGMFVRIRVPESTREKLLVPDVALQADQGGRFLLVVNDKNVVEHRRVRVGQLVDQMRVIEDGVSEKDRIIVNGLQRARPGGKVNPKESETGDSKKTQTKNSAN